MSIVRRLRSRRALTLVEVLLAVLLLGLTATMGAGVLSHVHDLQLRVQSERNQLRQALLIIALLERDLSGLTAFDFSGSYPHQTALAGESRRLRFLVEREQEGLVMVEYVSTESPSVSDSADESQNGLLLRRSAPLLAVLARRTLDEEAGRIVDSEVEVHFQYASGLDAEGRWRWRSSWHETELPAAIHLRIDARQARTVPLEWIFVIPQGRGIS